jgi:hypothetical protein
MANKTARRVDPRRSPVRKTAPAKRAGYIEATPHWRKALERNLIREGYSPAEAKELVALSAA